MRTWYAATRREQALPEGEDGCADFVAVLHPEGGGTEGESLGVHPVSYTHLTLPTNREV